MAVEILACYHITTPIQDDLDNNRLRESGSRLNETPALTQYCIRFRLTVFPL